jgi:hypothetical protein
MRNPLNAIFRWAVFKAGDLRWIGWKHFPFIATWDAYTPKIDQYEIHEAMKIARAGDVIILRHDGYASNLGIGGTFVHAAMCIGNDEVVEALSDDQGGVVRRHIADTLQADIAVILRPTIGFEVVDAVLAAKSLVGFKYDYLFHFNTQEEKKLIERDYKSAKAGKVLFCCTEIPFYCYMASADTLGLKTKRRVTMLQRILSLLGIQAGEHVITADMYLDANFKPVWASKEAPVMLNIGDQNTP